MARDSKGREHEDNNIDKSFHGSFSVSLLAQEVHLLVAVALREMSG